MSRTFLQTIGLTETESTLYELLLTLGEVPVPMLIKQSKLKRPTVYKVLQTLQKKGLVTLHDIRKILHAKPESPAKLQELAEKKCTEMEQAKQSLLAMLPAMALSYTHSTEKPVVKVFEGIDGLKEIYLDTLKEAQPISAILQASTVDPTLYDWLNKTYVAKRVKQKIHAKVIMDSGKGSKEYISLNTKSYRTTKLIDTKRFPFQHEINIYSDKVAIIHYRKDEPLIGILIQHPQIAKTMRAWFDLTWSLL